MIGLARGTVKLLPYNYEWIELYKQEEKLLRSLIGQYVIDIQHVGSTSIEGLDAKPIIDIAIGVKSLDDVENFRNILESAGYQFRGSAGVEGRLMFAKGSEDLRTHYLHIEVFGGGLWENHIYFRDYLRLNKESVEEYSRLKKELAEKFQEDRKSYTSAKSDFINSTLKKAREEFKEIYKEKDYKLNLEKETQHFIIDYTELDKTCIDKVSEVLENSYNRITSNLNQQLQEKLTIEVHSDLNQLHIALGFPNAPEWVRGGLGVGKIVIASPLNPPPGSKFDNVLNTAVHEFVHIIVNKINKDTPRWLNEGIACFEAKDNDENWIRKTVKNGLVSNMLPTFKDLDTGKDFETFFKRDGYQYSYTIIESIIEEFGYDKLYSLIKSPDDFVDIFDMTESQLQNKWIEYIKKNYLMS